MGPQDGNKSRLRDLLLASDAGDIDRALGFYAPDYVDHDASEARRSGGGAPVDALREGFRLFGAAFSDIRHTLHDAIEEGDRVAARISVEARHTGSLWGFAPSGRVVRNDSIVIYRFVDGRIRERWCRERRTTRSLLESDTP
ncbi:MAG TPA: ester cyclase [Vicinamibacterales bacterium]|nr:ester cyclase [Vicinamibacterales bacterium]